jgi:hypothetical protein
MKSVEKMACSFDLAQNSKDLFLKFITWALIGIYTSWRFKKSALSILFKIARISPLTALNVKKLGVAFHKNLTYPSIT